MKKIIQMVTTVLMLACFAFGVSACKEDDVKQTQNEPTQIEQVYAQYVVYAKAEGKTPLSYEEWLASIKGDSGRGIVKVEIIDGCLWVTYTDSETPVNVGTITKEEEEQGTEGLAYYPLSDGTYAVAQGHAMYLEEIVIPATHNGKPVTTLIERAFESCNAKTITISNSVTSIGAFAFTSCSSLTNVVIGESVKSIGDDAFRTCIGLTSVTLPDSVTSIGDGAFSYCKELTSITIGNSVTVFGKSAFYRCDSLQYTVKDNLKYLGNDENAYLWLMSVGSEDITTATIEANCKFIYPQAFSYCSSLTSVMIPNGVTSIGDSAFYGCYGLTNVTLPNSVTSIDKGAFCNCYGLKSLTIPNSVTSIAEGTFSGCSGLTGMDIPDNVTSIGVGAFRNCRGLKSVTIGDSVTSIGEEAFRGCNGLTSVTIPNSVISIGDEVFYDCSSLTTVTIGNSVTSIGIAVFYDCSSLTSINVNENNTEYRSIDGNLYTKDATTLLQYTRGKTATSFTILDTVTSIADGAFYECTNLTHVVIPDSVTSIGYSAFSDCWNVTIYCEAESQPSGWNSRWNSDNRPVIWGYKGEQ